MSNLTQFPIPTVSVNRATFKGDKGDKGDTGAVGPQGPQGPQGIPGPIGSEVSAVVARFASPLITTYIPGQIYDNSFHAPGTGALAGVADRCDMGPFFTATPLTIDQIGVAVSTAVAGSNLKVVVYGSGADGWPDQLIHETGNLSGATAGYVSENVTLSFAPATVYWFGVRSSATAAYRVLALTNSVNLGLSGGGNGTTYNAILRRSIPFANAAPSNWNFATADRFANIAPPSVRFRVATP
jgi:hypothetical protein